MSIQSLRQGAGRALMALSRGAALGLGALHLGCTKNDSSYEHPAPAISSFQVALANAFPSDPTLRLTSVSIPVGGSVWCLANFGAKDGSASVTPGNIQVTSNVPFQIANINASTTYTLTVTGPGGATVSRVQVIVTPVPLLGEAAATIVTVVSAPGLYGAFYRTAVQLANPSDSLAFGRLVYHPKERSGSAGDSFARYTLQPRQTVEFPNVLGLIGTSGNGSLDVVPEGGAVPVVRARVYNDAGLLGTTGVTEDALPPGDALGVGDTALLVAPSDFQKFRFSVGLRTLASGATLTFTLRDAFGTVLRRFTENYPGTFYIQRSGSDFFDGATFAGNESVTVEVSRD